MIKLKHLLPECEECGRDWNHGHDHEASMAKNELRDMISNASKIDNLVGENDDLPGWVSAYISLASDYMHSVAEYLAGESSEMQHEPAAPTPGYAMYEDKKKDKKWIQKAVDPEHKGDLHKALHVKKGEKIPKAKLNKATHSKDPHVRHMAQFAKNIQK